MSNRVSRAPASARHRPCHHRAQPPKELLPPARLWRICSNPGTHRWAPRVLPRDTHSRYSTRCLSNLARFPCPTHQCTSTSKDVSVDLQDRVSHHLLSLPLQSTRRPSILDYWSSLRSREPAKNSIPTMPTRWPACWSRNRL